MSSAGMFSAPMELRSTAIAAGYSVTSCARLSDRDQAVLALSQVRSDADGHVYRSWRRVGSLIQLALYLPAVALFVLFLVTPSMAVLLGLLAVGAMEFFVQRHRRRIARRAVAMLDHPAGKGRSRER